MTYIADLDPNSPALLSAEAYAEQFEEDFPNWRVDSLDRESRPEISEDDILDRNPATVPLRRYGSDDPGRY